VVVVVDMDISARPALLASLRDVQTSPPVSSGGVKVDVLMDVDTEVHDWHGQSSTRSGA